MKTLMLILLLVTLAMPAFAVSYEVIDLLSNSDYTDAQASGINDDGVVVGTTRRKSDSKQVAFLWKNGVVTILPSGGMGRCINNNGHVVGWGSAPQHAALWSNGVFKDLGTLGGSQSWGHGINENGLVVGSSFISTGAEHPFLWSNGTMTDLNIGQGRAFAINNNNLVTGWTIDNGYTSPFVWNNGNLTYLPKITPNSNSGAHALNDNGCAAGYVSVGNSWHAALWEDNLLIDLDPNGITSIANGINDLGQVVGQYYDIQWTSGGFLWSDGTLYNLKNLIPSNSGLQITWASDINNKGQIVGSGSRTGSAGAFLLNPVPEPSSLLVICIGIAGLYVFRRQR